jgi:ATP phosphoribosyltransferase regulatory subunit
VAFDVPQNWAEQPSGMHDLYPKQAKLRRQMETRLLEFFEDNGFDMVSSGAIEYVDTLSRGRQAQEANEWIRFVDSNGRMVALRPDMTPSIARMAAPLLHSSTREIRWCYAEKVYRRSTDPASLSWLSGKAAESTQVGVEWIGRGGPEADAELLALCQRAVEHLGLEDWQLVISHAAFAPKLLEVLDVVPNDRTSLLQYLIRGDYVGFREFCRHRDYEHDLLGLLTAANPLAHDSFPAEVRHLLESSPAGTETLAVWDSLVALAHVLAGQGLAERVSFDLTLVRDLSYYTGIVFEVFIPGVGAPIALGGRYDDLLSHFGTPAPAIGFVFEVERLLAAMTDRAFPHEEIRKEGPR